MTKAAVIGSGITGPMSAIILAEGGYDVTVFDARPAEDLHSDGILGITATNWAEMQSHGVKLARFALDNTYQQWPLKEVKRSEYQYIVWTDLHTALTEAAEEKGVNFVYSHKVERDSTEFISCPIVIQATGVGSAKEVTKPEYTGYVVMRALAYQFSGSPWTTIYGESNSGEWLFNVGDTNDGASIEFFVRRQITYPNGTTAPSVQMRTTYSAVAPVEINDLPERFKRLSESAHIWQTAPLSDWQPPYTMAHGSNGQRIIRIGDANGQMRPQTSQGANLAIQEAVSLDQLISGDSYREYELVQDRMVQFHRGIDIGIQRGKFSK